MGSSESVAILSEDIAYERYMLLDHIEIVLTIDPTDNPVVLSEDGLPMPKAFLINTLSSEKNKPYPYKIRYFDTKGALGATLIINIIANREDNNVITLIYREANVDEYVLITIPFIGLYWSLDHQTVGVNGAFWKDIQIQKQDHEGLIRDFSESIQLQVFQRINTMIAGIPIGDIQFIH